MIFATHEKLEIVEQLIDLYREAGARPQFETQGNRVIQRGELNIIYHGLKAVAADLRARLDGAPEAAEVEIERKINAAVQGKKHPGHDRRMILLAELVIARWPLIKQALERFEQEVSA